jgi:copper chaperone
MNLSTTRTYVVSSMSCGHCVNAITSEVSKVVGVSDISIDLDTKLVAVSGSDLNDEAIRQAIDEAGFEAELA